MYVEFMVSIVWDIPILLASFDDPGELATSSLNIHIDQFCISIFFLLGSKAVSNIRILTNVGAHTSTVHFSWFCKAIEDWSWGICRPPRVNEEESWFSCSSPLPSLSLFLPINQDELLGLSAIPGVDPKFLLISAQQPEGKEMTELAEEQDRERDSQGAILPLSLPPYLLRPLHCDPWHILVGPEKRKNHTYTCTLRTTSSISNVMPMQ